MIIDCQLWATNKGRHRETGLFYIMTTFNTVVPPTNNQYPSCPPCLSRAWSREVKSKDSVFYRSLRGLHCRPWQSQCKLKTQHFNPPEAGKTQNCLYCPHQVRFFPLPKIMNYQSKHFLSSNPLSFIFNRLIITFWFVLFHFDS